MHSSCLCHLNGCFIRKNNVNRFLKKPLVAVSVLVIITMCLTLGEAAATRATEHRRRHHRKPDTTTLHTKDVKHTRPNTNDYYKNATEIIIRKLRNNLRHYGVELHLYKGTRKTENVTGNPSWLPKVNFVVMHKQHSLQRSPRRRLRYILPKLHKHVSQYQHIFRLLIECDIYYYGDLFLHLQKRRVFLNSTLIRIRSLMAEIEAAMNKSQVSIPSPEEPPSLEPLHHRVDSSQLDMHDQIAFRGYENLLENWRKELRCSQKRKNTLQMCREYEDTLRRRGAVKERKNKERSYRNG